MVCCFKETTDNNCTYKKIYDTSNNKTVQWQRIPHANETPSALQ